MKELRLLPENWARVSLAEVVAVNPKHKDLVDQVAGFVPMKLAPKDFNGTLHYEERQWDKIKKGYTHFATGDVIFAKVTPCFENGKAAIVKNIPNGIGAGSTEFYVLRPANNDISVDYIFSVIKSHEFLHSGAENMTGAVGLRRVPKKFVEDFKINLPPPAEQQEIVALLDKHLAQVESTKNRLDAIPEILKRFRQSVLAAAVSGKLTEEWRSVNKTTSVKNLVKEIAEEREKLKAKKILKKSFGPSSEPLPLFLDIPNHWAWVTFSHIAINENNALKAGPFGSALKKSDCVESGFKVYGQEQVIAGDEKLVSYFVDATKYEQLISCRVQPNDILISLVGTIGKILVLSASSEKGIINPRLVKLSLNNKIQHQFIRHYLDSPISKEFFKGFSHGGTMDILNLSILKALPIALPPVDEQVEIVRRIEELFAYADKVEAQVNAAQERVNNLTQSILAKAFSSELTATWREQNPDLITGKNSAEALLEKIKAERSALTAKKKPAKKPTARKEKTSRENSD